MNPLSWRYLQEATLQMCLFVAVWFCWLATPYPAYAVVGLSVAALVCWAAAVCDCIREALHALLRRAA